MTPSPDVLDHPARVLIVDDDSSNRELLEVMLTSGGYLLQFAASGEEALAMVAREPPDLILMDVMMPGVDGHSVTRRIRSGTATRNIPIMVISALYDRKARMLALDAGAVDFLNKPVDHAELCMRVRTLLRLKAYVDFHEKYGHAVACECGRVRTWDAEEPTAVLSLNSAHR